MNTLIPYAAASLILVVMGFVWWYTKPKGFPPYRICEECGDEWTDTGKPECPMCGSEMTFVDIRPEGADR